MNRISDRELAVSILLPIFLPHIGANDIFWLKRAIESVHDQAFPGDVEILILDDGSVVPVESFATEVGIAGINARWIRHNRNCGLVHALNSGLRHASYPLIATMGARDEWLPDKIAKQLALFADSDLTIAGSGMDQITPSGEVVYQHMQPAGWSSLLRFTCDIGCPFPHGSVIAKTAIYRLFGGYPHNAAYLHCEDFALWSIWLRFFKPAMLESVFCHHRVTDTDAIGDARLQEQKARASGIIRQRFRSLQLSDSLPGSLQNLAAALGVPVIDAGKLAYAMWHYGIAVRLPQAAAGPLAGILPDRNVSQASPGVRIVDSARELGLTIRQTADTTLVAYPV